MLDFRLEQRDGEWYVVDDDQATIKKASRYELDLWVELTLIYHILLKPHSMN